MHLVNRAVAVAAVPVRNICLDICLDFHHTVAHIHTYFLIQTNSSDHAALAESYIGEIHVGDRSLGQQYSPCAA